MKILNEKSKGLDKVELEEDWMKSAFEFDKNSKILEERSKSLNETVHKMDDFSIGRNLDEVNMEI
jgi:hypothetical protein